MDITIVLIRHAQHQDTGGITGGDQDPSLSENGIGEAKRLGDIFERVYPNTYHIVYHSGMERAKQTAELAAEPRPWQRMPASRAWQTMR